MHQRRLRRRAHPVRGLDQASHDAGPLTRLHPGGDDLPHRIVERDQSRCVPLPQQDQGEGGGDPVGVRPLGEPGRRATPRHRATDVHQNHRPQVGLFLELLDEQPVRASQDLPVEVAELVPWLIRAVLRELDGEPAER